MRKFGYAALALAFCIVAGQWAQADEIVTTTTTTSAVSGGPSVVILDTKGAATTLPLIVSKSIVVVTALTPPDLIVRRDDLLARILVERQHGWITADQAQTFTDRALTIDGNRAHLTRDGSTVEYRMVKDMYKSYDRLAADMQETSGKSDRDLAGLYRVVY